MTKTKIKPKHLAPLKEAKISKPHVKSRRQQALETCCPYHPVGEETQAEEFCGAWINDGSGDLGSGQECHIPLCREHAEIRYELWLCPKHARTTTAEDL